MSRLKYISLSLRHSIAYNIFLSPFFCAVQLGISEVRCIWSFTFYAIGTEDPANYYGLFKCILFSTYLSQGVLSFFSLFLFYFEWVEAFCLTKYMFLLFIDEWNVI